MTNVNSNKISLLFLMIFITLSTSFAQITVKETNDASTSFGRGIITSNGNRPAAWEDINMSTFLLNNHTLGNISVNYIGSDATDFDPWNPGHTTAMRFALPASSLTISSAKLRVKVVDVVGSPVATLVSTDDNNWNQTSENLTSSFPFTTNSIMLASNVSITAANANDWKEFDVTSYVSTKTNSSSTTDITLILSGSDSGDNYFNFVADDQLKNDANAQIAELVITYEANTPTSITPTIKQNLIAWGLKDGRIAVSGVDNAIVTVYNQTGQFLYNEQVQSGIINRNFTKGVYILHLEINGKTTIQKVVVT